jgi:hypothetical protein
MAAACYAAARIRACGLEMRQLVAQALSDWASWTGDPATSVTVTLIDDVITAVTPIR